MKPKITPILIAFGLILFFLSDLLAMPKYTDKETALKLAMVLDEGSFGRYTVTSTYVQNEDINEYYLSVILSDGSAKKWYIDQIYKWARDDRLVLSGNRALIFLNDQEANFHILHKNKFHETALKANVFIKEFSADDPLYGNAFRFRIKNFSLIAPDETAFGRDAIGSKYRYIIDLFNGNRELLTYEDAYRIMENIALLEEGNYTEPTFEKAYHITRILPKREKKQLEQEIQQFGVEVHFNQPINLIGDYIPYVMYEQDTIDSDTGKLKNEFFIDFTIPNSEEKFTVKPIKNLEYLYDIHVVKDPKYPRRILLRSAFNPSVMDIPPIVYKNGDNSLKIIFFNRIDQSKLSRGMLLEAKQRREAEQSSMKEIKIEKVIEKDSDYRRTYIAATELFKESQTIRETLPKIQKLLNSIKQFEKAALLAADDSQLYAALMQRNKLRNSVIVLSLDYVRDRLATEKIASSEVTGLIGMLDQAEAFSRNQQVIKNIELLREKLNLFQ